MISSNKDELLIFLNHMCRNWVVVSGAGARTPNGILGLLCRQHYPGVVTYNNNTLAPCSFDHYAIATDTEPYPNKTARVIGEFWVSLLA